MQVSTLTKKLPLSLLPCEVYGLLAQNGQKAHTVLLETAEPGTQKSKRSISMVSAAAIIEGINGTVTISSLNDNGACFIKELTNDSQNISSFYKDVTDDRVTFSIKQTNDELISESQRLVQTTIADILFYIEIGRAHV